MISVIVPVYKAEAYLEACVNSIKAQTYADLEIILVNDGSPDRCREMCDAYAKTDNRIKVIHKTNGGVASARNAGINAAQGEYIAFVDSDDTIDNDMYEHLYKRITEENADMSVCGLKMIYEGYTRIAGVPREMKQSSAKQSAAKLTPKELWASYLSDFRTYYILFAGPCNKLIRTSLLERKNTQNAIRFPEDLYNVEEGFFVADCVENAENGIVFADINPYNYSQTNNPQSLSKTESYNNISMLMEHIKIKMQKALPQRADEIEKTIEHQNRVNKMIAVHVAITNKLKPPFKLTWAMTAAIYRESKSREEKYSALLIYILPAKLYRAAYMLYCKRTSLIK
ncbi:MAG: glycosyltransferase [Oscillospiraceae bacterium]|jgi:glycosyltransferase involved in cell wall biosynthesis|nr:glycosyltransferase [Oscillospiraceae bacterium]